MGGPKTSKVSRMTCPEASEMRLQKETSEYAPKGCQYAPQETSRGPKEAPEGTPNGPPEVEIDKKHPKINHLRNNATENPKCSRSVKTPGHNV